MQIGINGSTGTTLITGHARKEQWRKTKTLMNIFKNSGNR
jgi:hypothetical protein